MKYLCLLAASCLLATLAVSQQPVPNKPRILISTDIGGTDPDDNQSMAHLLMYSDWFDIEGLVSSPSYGQGSTAELFRMIDLYEKDYPTLQQRARGLTPPDRLRLVVKQGRKGAAPYKGYQTATEGSDWIVQCARRTCDQPLWILVWGGLEDVAQALHDATDIQSRIRVYWIGGPNKKWSANSYAYLASHFPNLWFIEVNSSYYGFFSDNQALDSIKPSEYYQQHIRGGGALGLDFKSYYKGAVKMGDTPSLLYMMDGDPANPVRESWGGSFQPLTHSPRVVFNGTTTLSDTVAFCSVLEFHFKGPELTITPDSVCFWMDVPYGKTVQRWPGYYLGNGDYALRYIPKKAEVLTYRLVSEYAHLNGLEGSLVVDNHWPGKRQATDYPLGSSWFTDRSEADLYDGQIQGGITILKWREAVLMDWAKRWSWLR